MKKIVISLLLVMAVVFCFSEKSFAVNTITSTQIADVRMMDKMEINFSSVPEYAYMSYKDKDGNRVYIFEFLNTKLVGKNQWFSPTDEKSGIKKISVVRYSISSVRVVVVTKANCTVSKIDADKKLTIVAKSSGDIKKEKSIQPKNKIKKSNTDDKQNIKKVVVEFETAPVYEKSSYVDDGKRLYIYNFSDTSVKANDWLLPENIGSEIEQVSIVAFNPETARIVIRVSNNIGIKESVSENRIIFSAYQKSEKVTKTIPEKKNNIMLYSRAIYDAKDNTRVIEKFEVKKSPNPELAKTGQIFDDKKRYPDDTKIYPIKYERTSLGEKLIVKKTEQKTEKNNEVGYWRNYSNSQKNITIAQVAKDPDNKTFVYNLEKNELLDDSIANLYRSAAGNLGQIPLEKYINPDRQSDIGFQNNKDNEIDSLVKMYKDNIIK